jgi:hypothetical protein
MLKLLNKTLVLTFYQQHAGLFLVVLYLLFGAVEGSQIVSYQKALLLAVASSPSLLFIVFGFWLLYVVKCIHFMHKKQAQENYGFLQLLNTLSKKRQQQLWAYVYALCFAPILIYAILIVLMSISSGYLFSAIATLIFVPALIFIATIYTYHQINQQYKLSKTFLKLPSTLMMIEMVMAKPMVCIPALEAASVFFSPILRATTAVAAIPKPMAKE